MKFKIISVTIVFAGSYLIFQYYNNEKELPVQDNSGYYKVFSPIRFSYEEPIDYGKAFTCGTGDLIEKNIRTENFYKLAEVSSYKLPIHKSSIHLTDPGTKPKKTADTNYGKLKE